MKMKTADLTEDALDWAVRECLDRNQLFEFGLTESVTPSWRPSTSWSQGGPIIERERIELTIRKRFETDGRRTVTWVATTVVRVQFQNYQGIPTPFVGEATEPLVAAMRSYVASKLGAEVEVPDA